MGTYSRRGSDTYASGSLTSTWTDELTFQLQNQDTADELHPILVIRTGNAEPIRLEATHRRSAARPTLTLDVTSPASPHPLTLALALDATAPAARSARASVGWN